jgi:hypothetical protein
MRFILATTAILGRIECVALRTMPGTPFHARHLIVRLAKLVNLVIAGHFH